MKIEAVLALAAIAVAQSTVRKCGDIGSTVASSSSKTSTAVVTEPSSIETPTCSGSFDRISAEEYVQAMNPGWNLGNTLDAVPDEGSWNNPKVEAATFAQVKAAGFKSVRIPVTYGHHYTSEAPDYTIEPAWLDRVGEVVDMALDAGLYVMTNLHHDSWIWADITSGADKDMVRDKFYKTWLQIGAQLACKSNMVSFETINEPPAETKEDADFINELNEIFLQALEEAGGFNTDRVVTLVGPTMDATKTSQWFEPPINIKNPWALQYHYYSPYDFTFSAWGKTSWGATSELATLEEELTLVPGNFSSIPLVIGEFDASQINCEPAARWKWFDAVVRMAQKSNTALMVWDNGIDNLNRDTGVWRDLTAVEIMVKSLIDGETNSLPDATTDVDAIEQDSSAYVFHRLGDPVEDYELVFTFNGNTLVSITTTSLGTKLSSPSDYVVSDNIVTLTSSFLMTYLDADAGAGDEPGVKDTLTFEFSSGASPRIDIVVWDIPDFSSTSSQAVAGSEVSFTIETKGVDRIATAKMVLEDGTFMFDDWTTYLGPLQQARGTWNSQFYYEYGMVYIREAVADMVVAAGQNATITFEFYPRVEGNKVVYTLTV